MPRVAARERVPLAPAKKAPDRRTFGFHLTKCPRCGGRGKILTAVRGWCPTCQAGYVRR